MASIWASTNVLNLQSVTQEVLNELNILLRILREILPLRDTRGGGLPSRKSLIHNLDLGQNLKVSWEGSKGLAVVLVSDSDLELIKVIEDIELGEVERGVVVNLVGVGHEIGRASCRERVF